MNNNQKISVILSVFNDSKNIEKSILSILNQTYKNLELLVMDDCSSDNTFEIISSFNDKRLKIFKNKKNIGLTKSLNFLIKNSEGNLIARQDSDDISFKDRLEKQYNFLIKKNLDACTSRALRKDNNKKIPKISYLFSNRIVMRYKNPFIHGTLLIKKSALEKVGYYDENFEFSQDYKLYSDILKNKLKIKTLNKTLYLLNMDQNISKLKKHEQREAFQKIRKTI